MTMPSVKDSATTQSTIKSLASQPQRTTNIVPLTNLHPFITSMRNPGQHYTEQETSMTATYSMEISVLN